MALKLQDFIDVEQFQMLQDRLNEIYSFPSSIIDNEGNILTATAWQDVCTKFHRQNPECEKECIKSDQYIASHLHEANPAVSYRCPHGLIDNATPIIIEGVHYGNYFTGQFFLEPPDLNFFRDQAKRYGFDEEAYIDAVKRVPIWTEEQLNSYLFFIKGLIEVISGIGRKNLKEIETRKRMQESEEQFKAMFEMASIGMAQADPQTGKWFRVNQRMCEITGYSPDEMLTMHVPEITHPEDREKDWELFQNVVNGHSPRYRIEKRYIRKDGAVIWVNVNMTVIHDVAGLPVCTIATIEDITERKRMEEELEREKTQLFLIFDRMSAEVSIVDPRTHEILFMNRCARELYGESTGRFCYSVFHGGDAPCPSCCNELLLEINDGEFIQREVFSEPIGRYYLTTNNLIGWPDGRRVKLEISIDITDKKRAEEERQRSLAEAERLAAEMAVIAEIGRVIGETLDIDEVYERLAAETKKLIRFDRLAVNLHSLHDENVKVAYVSGENFSGRCKGDLFLMKGSICEVLTTTRAGLLDYPENMGGVKRHFHDHRAPIHMRMSSLLRVPLIYRDEVIGSLYFGSKTPNTYTERDLRLAEKIGAQIAGALGSAKLFSEHKQAEAERHRLQERLQRAEKMEALGQLAGGVAHDLNNVLGILSGYSELLLDEIPEGSRSRGHAEKILQSTEKGAAIIQDLLTLARRGVTTSDVIHLNRIVTEFIQTPMFEKLKDRHPRVTFRTELDPNLLNIEGSPVHLEKTLMNLVSNAAESISGMGEVTIRTESRYLDKAVRGYDEVNEGDYTVLTVSDTGMGIPAENREKIFEPFYTKKRMGRSGTGLGLAIVWGTVKDHNGYIDVQTEVGKGSTFTLFFPVTRKEMVEQQRKVPVERYMGKGESVLVVDDIAEQRDVASRLITRLGYGVQTVSSGEEAVEYFRRNKADILVLDMIMAPGIDGLETYRRVLEINPRQKAILVSGFSQTERVSEAQRLGAGAYVKKPYVMEKIGMAIREELNKE